MFAFGSDVTGVESGLQATRRDDMDFKKLGQQAKALVDKRGGTESLKEDADELKDIAKGSGSLADKAKAAAAAIKDPGSDEAATPAPAPASPAAEASEPELERAEEKVEGEERGKHAGGGGQGRHHRRHGHRGGGQGGV
jgi:hypothetical protein